jgi:hypothetical protein
MDGQVPELEKLEKFERNEYFYNQFSGLISRRLAVLDTLNMTMLNEKVVVFRCYDGHRKPLVSEE